MHGGAIDATGLRFEDSCRCARNASHLRRGSSAMTRAAAPVNTLPVGLSAINLLPENWSGRNESKEVCANPKRWRLRPRPPENLGGAADPGHALSRDGRS